jgi:hypothetical protein
LWDSIWKFAIEHYIFHTIIIIVLPFLIFGKYHKVVFGKNGLEVHKADETGKSEIQSEHESKLNNIEKILDELKNAIETNDYLTGKTSEGTLVGLLFNDAIWPFLRMKSFRRLLALYKNGRIWEKGFALISGSTEYQKAWLDVQEIELDIEIENEEYYYGRLREIENRITHDFSKRTV